MYLKRSCFVVGPAVALAVALAVQVAVNATHRPMPGDLSTDNEH